MVVTIIPVLNMLMQSTPRLPMGLRIVWKELALFVRRSRFVNVFAYGALAVDHPVDAFPILKQSDSKREALKRRCEIKCSYIGVISSEVGTRAPREPRALVLFIP